MPMNYEKMKLSEKFPEFYQKLFPEFLAWEVPKEKLADCTNCHLCSTPKRSVSTNKCCTYYATLPNYMVGAILSEQEEQWAAGKKVVLDNIAKKKGVTPYGITSPKEFVELNEEMRKAGKLEILSYDDREKLTCAYLDDGKCTVWKYRSELCITYFCHSVGALAGTVFWESLYKYVRYIEKQLSVYALIQLKYPLHKLHLDVLEPKNLYLQNDDFSLNETVYKNLWKGVEITEAEFYIECYNIINDLSQTEYENIVGMESKWYQQKLKSNLKNFINNLQPLYVKFKPEINIEKKEDNLFRLSGNHGESIDVNFRQLAAIKALDGTKNITDILREHHNLVQIDNKLMKQYLKVGIVEAV